MSSLHILSRLQAESGDSTSRLEQLRTLFEEISSMTPNEAVAAYQAITFDSETAVANPVEGSPDKALLKKTREALILQMVFLAQKETLAGKERLAARFAGVTGLPLEKFQQHTS